ncbi:carbamoyltransferase N-terminal domain-containing protein [Nonomuraea sp. B10E15]|uniref:carbamoyltransferase N-terminal domain-containing protein n=1 Tax=Nonomuraea sp. B10E15 TaxID=3153560 RepID=UPI00325CD9B5
MLICGLKLTHDAGVAVVKDGELVFSIEVEKLANRRRYSPMHDLDQVVGILAAEGFEPGDIDRFVIDGWMGDGDGGPAGLATCSEGRPLTLRAAPYHEPVGAREAVSRLEFGGLPLGGRSYRYSSYAHAVDHLYSAYCTSPFAERGEDALVLIWDAGMAPRLYHVRAAGQVEALGALFPLAGSAFASFSLRFEPFRRRVPPSGRAERVTTHLEVAGKAMAFAGLGTVEPGAFGAFDDIVRAAGPLPRPAALAVAEQAEARRAELFRGLSEADLIATYQAYLGELLLAGLRRKLDAHGGPGQNLCVAGGCALNIKWNSSLRRSGLFRAVWVPPFPNDSGSALGAACAELAHLGTAALSWEVYSGPRLDRTPTPPGWRSRACDETELARVLHEEDEPVTVVDGRAELGPRALGNRSILSAPVSPGMKDRLNEIKHRSGYRPVAPVCLESRAAEIFDPGLPDPYMLFDHVVRAGWTARVPAVLHVDGTARLQTVTAARQPVLARVLQAYERLSGIPVLCNTSANFNGSGFFPDLASAMRWNGTRHIWSEGVLHTRRCGAPSRAEPSPPAPPAATGLSPED